MADRILDDLEPKVKARIAELAKLWNVSGKEVLDRLIQELPQKFELD